jgi:hypothetical protein
VKSADTLLFVKSGIVCKQDSSLCGLDFSFCLGLSFGGRFAIFEAPATMGAIKAATLFFSGDWGRILTTIDLIQWFPFGRIGIDQPTHAVVRASSPICSPIQTGPRIVAQTFGHCQKALLAVKTARPAPNRDELDDVFLNYSTYDRDAEAQTLTNGRSLGVDDGY